MPTLSSKSGRVWVHGVVRSVAHEAIVLRVRAYGESDKIVTFLTDAAGKLTGIAKGAKNSRRRFPNCLDPLARVCMHYRPRSGPGLVFLERCDLRRPATAYGQFDRLAYAHYLTELVDTLTEEAHAVPELFRLLDQALELMLTGPASAPFLRAFEMQLLHHTGYSPQLSECGRCKDPLGDAARAVLDLQHSSALCSRCSPGSDHPLLLPLRSESLATLEALKHLELPVAQKLNWDGRMQTETAAALSGLLAPHLRRPLRSLRVLQQLGHS